MQAAIPACSKIHFSLWRSVMSGSGKKFLAVFAFSLVAATAVIAAPCQTLPPSFVSPSATVSVVGKQALSNDAPSSAVVDVCLPLLKPASQPDPRIITEEPVRPLAGQAAALGLIFGVQFALGPRETTRDSLTTTGIAKADLSGNRALAIADYRRCRSEQLLTSL